MNDLEKICIVILYLLKEFLLAEMNTINLSDP